MDMKVIGKWSYIVGLVVAILAAIFGFSAGWLGFILALLAILAGLFYANADDLLRYGIIYLVLGYVGDALEAITFLGPIITDVAYGMLDFFAAVLVTLLLVVIFKHLYKAIRG